MTSGSGTSGSGGTRTELGLHDALQTVVHSGSRRVDFWDHTAEPARHLAYIESIATDGQGRFDLRMEDLISSTVVDPAQFALIHEAREGFVFRYRDFLVRDPLTFTRAWSLVDGGPGPAVLGRPVRSYQAERMLPPATRYELLVDEATGLILASREFDEADRLVATMEYTAFSQSVDVASTAWHVPSNQETVLDSDEDLQEALGIVPLSPKLLPAGYRLLEQATIVDDQQHVWFKQTYTDGVEALLFAFDVTNEIALAGAGGAVPPTDLARERLYYSRSGRIAAGEGRVAGHELFVIGKLSENEVKNVVLSALP
jgi:hypothetical protein